jgi:hypothetical protein
MEIRGIRTLVAFIARGLERMLSISQWTLLSLEQSVQTTIFAPSIMALIGFSMIWRPQTSHRIGFVSPKQFYQFTIVYSLCFTDYYFRTR